MQNNTGFEINTDLLMRFCGYVDIFRLFHKPTFFKAEVLDISLEQTPPEYMSQEYFNIRLGRSVEWNEEAKMWLVGDRSEYHLKLGSGTVVSVIDAYHNEHDASRDEPEKLYFHCHVYVQRCILSVEQGRNALDFNDTDSSSLSAPDRRFCGVG